MIYGRQSIIFAHYVLIVNSYVRILRTVIIIIIFYFRQKVHSIQCTWNGYVQLGCVTGLHSYYGMPSYNLLLIREDLSVQRFAYRFACMAFSSFLMHLLFNNICIHKLYSQTISTS